MVVAPQIRSVSDAMDLDFMVEPHESLHIVIFRNFDRRETVWHVDECILWIFGTLFFVLPFSPCVQEEKLAVFASRHHAQLASSLLGDSINLSRY